MRLRAGVRLQRPQPRHRPGPRRPPPSPPHPPVPHLHVHRVAPRLLLGEVILCLTTRSGHNPRCPPIPEFLPLHPAAGPRDPEGHIVHTVAPIPHEFTISRTPDPFQRAPVPRRSRPPPRRQRGLRRGGPTAPRRPPMAQQTAGPGAPAGPTRSWTRSPSAPPPPTNSGRRSRALPVPTPRLPASAPSSQPSTPRRTSTRCMWPST